MLKRLSCIAILILIAASAAIAAPTNHVIKSRHIRIDGQVAAESVVVVDEKTIYVPVSLIERLQGKTITYDSVKQVVMAESSGSDNEDSPSREPEARQPAVKPDLKPVLEVVMGEPECKEMVESLGLQYKSSVSVPNKLDFYSCVIINNLNAANPNIANRLKKYVTEGGGLVLVGSIPLKLDSTGVKNYDNVFASHGGTDMPDIVDWFGCKRIGSIQYNNTFWPKTWHGVPAEVLTKTNRALGTTLGKQTDIFKYAGSEDYAMLDAPDEFCEIVAVWQSQVDVQNPPISTIAAVVHTLRKRLCLLAVLDRRSQLS